MNCTSRNSESLVASLCKEADANRLRFANLIEVANKSTSPNLIKRVQHEMEHIERRQKALKRTVARLRNSKLQDSLSFEFLHEVSNRPLWVI